MREKCGRISKRCLRYLAAVVCAVGFFFQLAVGNMAEGQACAALRIFDCTRQQWLSYEKALLRYEYNGVAMSDDDCGILSENGASMGPLVVLFQTGLGLSCVYDAGEGVIKINDGMTEIVLTLGSRTAYVNGKSKTLTDAPVVLSLPDAPPRVYVPTRFVAEALGIGYEWDSAARTVRMTQGLACVYESADMATDELYITIPLPAHMKETQWRTEDQYLENKHVLLLSGDYVSLYQNGGVVSHCKGLTGVTVERTEAGETALTFSFARLYVADYSMDGEQLRMKLARPDEVYDKIIILDAGHGAHDPGAVREGINEKDINLAIAYTYTTELFAASDIKVYYTRSSDTYKVNEWRAAWAAQTGADFFISVHMNTNANTSLRGTSVYYSVQNNAMMKNGLTSRSLALFAQKYLTETLEMRDQNIQSENYTVLAQNSIPAVLIELGYFSTPEERALLVSPKFQRAAGEALYQMVLALYEQYPSY